LPTPSVITSSDCVRAAPEAERDARGPIAVITDGVGRPSLRYQYCTRPPVRPSGNELLAPRYVPVAISGIVVVCGLGCAASAVPIESAMQVTRRSRMTTTPERRRATG